MRTPQPDALRCAALWLESYEGTEKNDPAAAACAEVARWLSRKADAAELRQACRQAGVSLPAARAALRGRARRPGA